MNIGAGLVRVPSVASVESYDREYDLHYLDLDKELSERIQKYNDPRLITQSMHRDYDITDATVDYFTLNGRSFPYTFRESLLVGAENERIKLRVVNGGSKGIALHTHGHKFTVTDRDGVAKPEVTQVPQDVVWIATSQRVDLSLELTNDGLRAYGPGVWLFHAHHRWHRAGRQYQRYRLRGLHAGIRLAKYARCVDGPVFHGCVLPQGIAGLAGLCAGTVLTGWK